MTYILRLYKSFITCDLLVSYIGNAGRAFLNTGKGRGNGNKLDLSWTFLER